MQDTEIPPSRKMISYDVTALFTSIPMDKAVMVIHNRIREDQDFTKRSELSSEQFIRSLKFCLDTTYFKVNNKFYKQTHGAAVVSLVSLIVANLNMEEFETRALQKAPQQPHMATICG